MSDDPTSLPSMFSAEDFPAKTSAMQGDGWVSSQAHGAACGSNMRESLTSFDRITSSWRTFQHSLFGGLTLFSDAWPRSGTMRSGTVCRRPASAPLTDATESSWLPTPVAYDANPGGPNNHYHGLGCPAKTGDWPTPTARDWKDGRKPYDRKKDGTATQDTIGRRLAAMGETINGLLNPTWVEWLMGFPLGWTVLEPSETPSSRKSRKLSGG